MEWVFVLSLFFNSNTYYAHTYEPKSSTHTVTQIEMASYKLCMEQGEFLIKEFRANHPRHVVTGYCVRRK